MLALQTVWQHHMAWAAEKGKDIYTTSNMNGDQDQVALLSAKGFLLELVQLDPRGGVFSHGDMTAGLAGAIQTMQQRSAFPASEEDFEDTVGVMSYRARVMTSHLRQSFDSSTHHEAHALAELFAVMRPGAWSPESKRTRRDDRLHVRPHPFLNFREQMASDDDSRALEINVTEEPTKVTAYYDAKNMKARMLLSDGSEIAADRYMKGEAGFICAEFLQPQHILTTEVPNVFLKDGRIMKINFEISEDKGEPMCKRPAKAIAVESEESEEEPGSPEALTECDALVEYKSGGETAAAAAAAPFHFKTAVGHHGFTVVVVTKGSDKAQVLAVSKKTCEDPRKRCEEVVKKLYGESDKLAQSFPGSVRGQMKWLGTTRALARQLLEAC